MSTIEYMYEYLAPLKGHPDACLVLHRDTGRVYVKKCLSIYHLEVYRQLAGLHSPHIPRIYAYEEKDQHLYLIEEYINGRTLMEQLAEGRLFSKEDMLSTVLQICEALVCLHTLHPPVIHRDIKLSNVMITEDGIVKLIDYNAARCYMEGTAQDTMLLGTPDYAAPEQFGFAQTDARTDIYSLGVMMNYMLTGQSYKTGLYSDSKKIRQIIQRCTCLDPEKRYQTVKDLQHALQSCQTQRSRQQIPIHNLLPLPGFRSGKLWKKMTAVFGYLLLFLIVADVEIEGYQEMPIILLLSRFMTGFWTFSSSPCSAIMQRSEDGSRFLHIPIS